jgi:glucose dehydrogenase
MFARDPDDGQAVWSYQWSPHDLYDYDGINELILLDLPIKGQMRKVLVRPERDGYIYVLDRTTGEVLSADPYGYITTTKGIDLKTGRPIEVPEKAPETGKVVREICPAAPGAKDWQPSSYSPRTRLLYIPPPEPLPGRRRRRGQLHLGHALRGGDREDVCRPWW